MVRLQGLFKFHQYQVVGRHLPSEKEENPTIYRMKLWAEDAIRAKSKFWCAPVSAKSVGSLGRSSVYTMAEKIGAVCRTAKEVCLGWWLF